MNLSEIFPSRDFRGRTSLTVMEFAQLFDITATHVVNLIEEASLVGIDCSSGSKLSKRRLWRIPLSEVQRFAVIRSNLGNRTTATEVTPALGTRSHGAGEQTPTAPASSFAGPCHGYCNGVGGAASTPNRHHTPRGKTR